MGAGDAGTGTGAPGDARAATRPRLPARLVGHGGGECGRWEELEKGEESVLQGRLLEGVRWGLEGCWRAKVMDWEEGCTVDGVAKVREFVSRAKV